MMLKEGGVFGLLKPPGMTSHDAVAFVRRRLVMRRVGHGGTLDPAAAGVLPMLVGEATKLTPWLGLLTKDYRATVLFGVATDSADLAGTLQEVDWHAAVREDELAAAIAGLPGRIDQLPPAYSARRVGGRRLYERARTGDLSAEHIRQASREVQVHQATLVNSTALGWGTYADLPSATLDIRCSSGTYIRQLATRLGEELGLPACLAFLLRRRAAGLGLTDCLTIEGLTVPGTQHLDRLLAPVWRGNARSLGFLPGAVLGPEAAGLIAQGVVLDGTHVQAWLDPEPDAAAELAAGRLDRPWVRVISPTGSLLALATREQSTDHPAETVLRPRRVFAHVAAGWLAHGAGTRARRGQDT